MAKQLSDERRTRPDDFGCSLIRVRGLKPTLRRVYMLSKLTVAAAHELRA